MSAKYPPSHVDFLWKDNVLGPAPCGIEPTNQETTQLPVALLDSSVFSSLGVKAIAARSSAPVLVVLVACESTMLNQLGVLIPTLDAVLSGHLFPFHK